MMKRLLGVLLCLTGCLSLALVVGCGTVKGKGNWCFYINSEYGFKHHAESSENEASSSAPWLDKVTDAVLLKWLIPPKAEATKVTVKTTEHGVTPPPTTSPGSVAPPN